MKLKKKTVTTLALVGLLGVGTVGGTLAYLTDAENTTNTFTIGKIQIESLERHYPGNGTGEVTNITPNQVIEKDPTALNTGKNPAVVMVSYDIPMAKTVTFAEKSANKQAKPINHELFTTLLTGDKPDAARTEDGSNINPGWTLIKKKFVKGDGSVADKDDGNSVAARYLVGYDKVLGVKEETAPVFAAVRLNNYVEGDIDSTTQDITVHTYAIQSDDLTPGVKLAAGTEVKTQLPSIYEKYIAQNGEWMDGKDAGNSGALNLIGKERTATASSHVNISLSIDDTKLYVGDTAHAIATVDTDLNDVSYTLVSSGAGLEVTKTNEGYVLTAKAPGTYTITATSAAKASNGKQAIASVSVSVVEDIKTAARTTPGVTTGSGSATN